MSLKEITQKGGTAHISLMTCLYMNRKEYSVKTAGKSINRVTP